MRQLRWQRSCALWRHSRNPKPQCGSVAAEGQGAQALADGAAATADAAIDALIARRIEARKRKDFGEADRIRDELAEAGVMLEDAPGGATTWRRK